MNNLDLQYQLLLQDILDNGITKQDRTGTGTISVFGRQIRHKMSDGFPLLTTKKMPFKTITTELLWFLRGDTNIRYLVDNDCHIWDGDAYKNYCKYTSANSSEWNRWMRDNGDGTLSMFTQEEFINKIKTDDEFASSWGDLGPIYGNQWRSWVYQTREKKEDIEGIDTMLTGMDVFDGYRYLREFDQVANSIHLLKTDPDSRRNKVSAWNVGEIDQMVLPPCHTDFQFYTRELSFDERHLLYCKWFEGTNDNHKGSSNTEQMTEYHNNRNIPTRAISLMWNQRSVDTFLGLSFNIASYGLLLELIAKAVNMVPDELIGNLGDVHLYSNHIEQAKEQISRTPYGLPKLNINTEFWPTESGSCGEGPLDAIAVFNSFKNDNFCKCLLEEDLQLGNYQSHPHIKAPLSN
jgi:thymidylate synthase